MELPPQEGAGPESTGNENEEHEVLREDGPRIYVASLSDYNAGILHGDWIEGRYWLDTVLTDFERERGAALDEHGSVSLTALLARALHGAGQLELHQGELAPAWRRLEQSVTLWRRRLPRSREIRAPWRSR